MIVIFIFVLPIFYSSTLGGFVGLFLGYSFFNIILVVTDAVVIKIEKAMEKNKIKNEEHEAHEKWKDLIQQLIKKEMIEKEIKKELIERDIKKK